MTTIGDWVKQYGDPAASRSFGGVLPAYPIFMFIGIIAVIVCTIIKMRQKKIPLREFELAILIVVPIGIIGGSIFGKIFIPGLVWYHVFFFWEPGMSLFGALGLGITAGFAWFYRRSKKTLISVWVYADMIIPNILLGQAIGRWGNMYNHEILGGIVSYDSISWMGSNIANHLFYFPSLSGFTLADGWWEQPNSWASYIATSGAFEGLSLEQVMNWKVGDAWLVNSLGDALDPTKYNYGTIMYRSPLFFIESMLDLFLWLIISFVVTNLGRWFSKPKPWDLQPKAYPGWYNKQYKSLKQSDVLEIPTQLPVKYKQVRVTNSDGEEVELKLGFYQAWNKAFYWYAPDEQKIREYEIALEQKNTELNQGLIKLDKIKSEHKSRLLKIDRDYANKLNRVHKNTEPYNKVMLEKKLDINNEKELFKNKKEAIYATIGNWTRILVGDRKISTGLDELNNPNKFFVIRSGVLTGSFVFAYTFIRIILETQRKAEELFIQNSFVADFIVLALILLVGVAIIYITQFVAPYRYREVNWLYEKSY